MNPSSIAIALATEEDAAALASIMTAAFSASDAAYPLIWTSEAPEGVHDVVAVKGLFSPVQRELRVTFQAVEGEKVVGFATWSLPDVNAPNKSLRIEKKRDEKKPMGVPEIPGVNTALWSEKLEGPKETSDHDVEPSEDMSLSFFFVHPDYQRRGIGTSLLKWGIEKADETKAKIWLTGTPQAMRAYEKSGWEVVKRHEVDLRKYGGEGLYVRAWMVRLPRT